MQKYLRATIMALSVSALPIVAMAKPVQALVYEKTAVNVKSLDFDEILNRVYQTKPLAVPAALQEISKAPKAIIQARSEEQREYLLSMLPVVTYQNTAGETRYLVVVQKNNYYDGQIMSCRACSPNADMFIFKQIDKRYYLVSATFDMGDLPGGNGELKLDLTQVNKNMQPFGKELTGSYFEAEFSGAGGQRSSGWYGLLLREQEQIQLVFIGDAGGDTSSFYADRPEMAWTTTSTLKVMPNGAAYYPIQVTYRGIGGKLKKAEISHKSFVFDTKNNVFVEAKPIKK